MAHLRFGLPILVMLLLPSARAAACSDSGIMPAACVYGRTPFDAGPGCSVLVDSCGCYTPFCLPDAGPDTGPGMCTEFQDTGPDGVATRWGCATTSDCTALRPDMVCGGDGFCSCAPPATPARGSGCQVGWTAAGMPQVLALGAILLLTGRRRIARR